MFQTHSETLPAGASDLSARLLTWYRAGHRRLPWRPPLGALGDPYGVWLSEIMLQQTTVVAVTPYFEKFIRQWPTLADLAAADDAEVMAAWAGLGYYARARNLLACARAVMAQCDGRFPATVEGLRALPGIGPYTAAAIASIAFGQPVAAVDGNVERVMARLLDDATPLPRFRAVAQRTLAQMVPTVAPGDFTQAVIELGATVCRPRSPSCGECPWAEACRAFMQGNQAERPVKPQKPPRPERMGMVYWLERDGRVWLVRRPDHGLLGGMLALPGGPWADQAEPLPMPKDWHLMPYNHPVRHVLTHFALTLTVVVVTPPPSCDDKELARILGDGQWGGPSELDAMPSVMQKARQIAAPV